MKTFIIIIFYRSNKIPDHRTVSANNYADAILRFYACGVNDSADIFKIEIYQ